MQRLDSAGCYRAPMLLAAALAAACVMSQLLLGGWPSLPLDDPFIYFQYARQAAEGEVLRYTAGAPRSSGATSPAYLFMCTTAYLAGFRGAALIGWAQALGAILLVLMTQMAGRTAERLASPAAGRCAAWLVAANGPVLWAAMSGMDTGLFSAAVLATGLAMTLEHQAPRLRWTPAALIALACARPEGVFLAAGAAVLLRRARGGRRVSWWRAWLPVASGSLPLLATTLWVNAAAPSTFLSKSPLARGSDVIEGIERSLRFFAFILRAVVGGYGAISSQTWNGNVGEVILFVAPLMLPLFLLGALPAAAAERRQLMAGPATLGAWLVVGGFATAALLSPVHFHWNRYSVPYIPLFLVFAAAGLERMSAAASQLMPQWTAADFRKGAMVLFGTFSAASAVFFVLAYGENCYDIRRQHVAMARWVDQALPLEATVALNDAGALAYFGHRRIIDLVGLVSPSFILPTKSGGGSLFEALERLPESARPDVFIIYPDWFNLTQSSLLGPARHQIALHRVTIAGSSSPMTAYSSDWRAAGSGARIKSAAIAAALQNWAVCDEVDVADVESEAEHDYRLHGRLDPGVPTDVNALPLLGEGSGVIADGYRVVSLGESFDVRVRPDRPLAVVGRTLVSSQRRILVNGAAVSYWTLIAPPVRSPEGSAAGRTGWIEGITVIQPDYLGVERVRVTVETADDTGQPYISAHYWFFQPE